MVVFEESVGDVRMRYEAETVGELVEVVRRCNEQRAATNKKPAETDKQILFPCEKCRRETIHDKVMLPQTVRCTVCNHEHY
jgi:hypothetical protein